MRSRCLDIGRVLFFTLAKKNEANIQPSRPNLVNKVFIIWLSGEFFFRDTAGNPERARQLHSGSQSQRRMQFISCPLTELAI